MSIDQEFDPDDIQTRLLSEEPSERLQMDACKVIDGLRTQVDEQRGIIDKLRATGNACHRLVGYLDERDSELYDHAANDPAPVPRGIARAGLEEVRRALKIIHAFSSLEREYLQEREAELCKVREAAEAAQKGTSDGND